MANKIKCNDKIIIISGKYKGKRGKVLKILSKKKVIIKNINIFKKHQKPIAHMNKLGSIIKKEFPIDISNISILNKYTNKIDRVSFIIKNNKKIRLYKSNKKYIK
ncbi:50S ribosomal protein L24 [Enterobacterales bacterium endosymbiont of Anomoneura mori]|uniref:50S ribosomal protein L24 n=1 Tax=Enterobacterales bacterium endosymbiont of Anomoneura mori TaxID=3132096 RepID=UPI00399C7C9D